MPTNPNDPTVEVLVMVAVAALAYLGAVWWSSLFMLALALGWTGGLLVFLYRHRNEL